MPAYVFNKEKDKGISVPFQIPLKCKFPTDLSRRKAVYILSFFLFANGKMGGYLFGCSIVSINQKKVGGLIELNDYFPGLY